MTEPITTEPARPERRTVAVHLPTLLIAAAFGVIYAWFVWAAISDMIVVPLQFGQFDEGAPWGLLIASLLLPLVAWGVAFVIGRPRPSLEKVVLFVVGLATVAAIGFALDAAIAEALIAALRAR